MIIEIINKIIEKNKAKTILMIDGEIADIDDITFKNIIYTISEAYPCEYKRVPDFSIRENLESNGFSKLCPNKYEFKGDIEELNKLLIKRYEK
jgi:hypothetical protein